MTDSSAWLCARERTDGSMDYVSHLPGDGGVGWGYHPDESMARSLTDAQRERFERDMRDVDAKFISVSCLTRSQMRAWIKVADDRADAAERAADEWRAWAMSLVSGPYGTDAQKRAAIEALLRGGQ